MHLTQATPTNCIFSPQLDEFYHNMLWRLNEVLTHIFNDRNNLILDNYFKPQGAEKDGSFYRGLASKEQ
jgi:hypothetical protein